MWGKFKSRFGWLSNAFLIEFQNCEKYPLLALSRRIAPFINMAYIAWGPQFPDGFYAGDRSMALAELAQKLKPFFARNITFIRFDPPWHTKYTGSEAELFAAAGFKCAAATVQPPDTVIVSLQASCQQILAAMKPKWRYNISLAGKRGVYVKESGAENIEEFFSLLKETAARDGITVHNIGYYKTLFEVCGEQRENKDGSFLRLYTACHEGDTLAANVVLFRRETATYLYGASCGIKRNLMTPYILQWKAMQDAKESGCRYYDLFGIPPDDNPNHPMYGLYRFKTGFGGEVVHRPGSWDYLYKPAVYRLFNLAEAMRKELRDRKKVKKKKE